MIRQPLLATVACALLMTGMTRAEDWPQFRGPTGQGIASGSLPVRWSKDANVAWKRAIPGAGWSSPVVVGGRIYLTTAVPMPRGRVNDYSLRALCLDGKAGTVLWDREVFREDGGRAPRIHGKNSHASPTPLVQGGRLYVHFGHQGTACLDSDGKVLWRNAELKYKPVHGNGGTPVLADDLLIFSCDGGDRAFVVALERDSGKVRWKKDRDVDAPKTFSFGTPLLITVKGRKQVICPGSGAVMAYDPATGDEIWRVRYQGYSVIPRPVYGHGLVFLSTGFDAPVLLAVRPDGKGDVTDTHVAWTTRRSVSLTPSFLLVGNELYMVSDDGFASCLDAKTGRQHWRQRVGGHYSASPLYADGKIYLQSEEGPAVVLRAGTQFKQLARNTLGERALASYAAADGALFVRTQRHLYRIQAR